MVKDSRAGEKGFPITCSDCQSQRSQAARQTQISHATRLATLDGAHAVCRLEAIHLLAYLDWAGVQAALLTCDFHLSEPREIQQAGLRALGSMNQAEVATELISRWKQLTPPLREEAVNMLLSRPIWHEPLVAALEKGDIPDFPSVDSAAVAAGGVKDEQLAERAKKVLASFALGPRKEVLDKYQAALSLEADAAAAGQPSIAANVRTATSWAARGTRWGRTWRRSFIARRRRF